VGKRRPGCSQQKVSLYQEAVFLGKSRGLHAVDVRLGRCLPLRLQVRLPRAGGVQPWRFWIPSWIERLAEVTLLEKVGFK
jgi:hypothetical protein